MTTAPIIAVGCEVIGLLGKPRCAYGMYRKPAVGLYMFNITHSTTRLNHYNIFQRCSLVQVATPKTTPRNRVKIVTIGALDQSATRRVASVDKTTKRVAEQKKERPRCSELSSMQDLSASVDKSQNSKKKSRFNDWSPVLVCLVYLHFPSTFAPIPSSTVFMKNSASRLVVT